MSLTAIIMGKLAAPGCAPQADQLAQALNSAGHTVLRAGDGQSNAPSYRDLDKVFAGLAARKEPASIMAFANEYNVMSRRGCNICGEDDGLFSLMQHAIEAGQAAPQHPLHVFVRTVGRPKNLRKYARQLPPNSVLAALRVDRLAEEGDLFWNLAGNYALHKSNPDTVRAMLRWAMLGQPDIIGVPMVAVSGREHRPRANEVWTRFSQLSQLPTTTSQRFGNDQVAMSSDEATELSHQLNTCLPYQLTHETSRPHYAIALDTMWDRYFAPTPAAMPATQAQQTAQPASTAATAADSAPTSRGASRPSPTEMGQLPKKLRQLISGNPRLARQIGLKR